VRSADSADSAEIAEIAEIAESAVIAENAERPSAERQPQNAERSRVPIHERRCLIC
jgi:hypothetical protein